MLGPDTPVSQLLMVGPSYASRLSRLGIKTVGDLLFHLPFRYENYANVSSIRNLQVGKKNSTHGEITSFENVYTKYGKKIQKAKIADETGEIEVVWYNQPYLRNILHKGMQVSLAGEVKWFGHKLVMESPEYELVRPTAHLIHTGRIVPVYPETEGVSSKWLRSRINAVLTKFTVRIPEILPPEIISEFHLISRDEAVKEIHFPQNFSDIEKAKRRLSFDELLTIEIVSDMRKKELSSQKVSLIFAVEKFKKDIRKFIDSLPFKLTPAQNRAIGEILTDLAADKPMNRLLEGDVGSGKTVVAAIAMYLAFLNGYRCVLIAPTEILATQHFQTINNLLSPYNVKTTLVTANTKSKSSTHKHQPLTISDSHIFIGTHALLSEKLKIDKLAFIVIDEQQRFGVRQRAILREKGENPHVLVLTATPIPRTIALTLYSDLALSVIDELPAGRQKIKTWVVPNEKREAAYSWIKKQIIDSNFSDRAFIICPFIDESETLASVKAAKTEFKRLSGEIFPDLKLGLLHGGLSAKAKQKVMDEFKNGNTQILVATPVVEVGIDVPQATIMMIEAADRFGLSQLHQIRGRVGRGEKPSFCLLFTDSENVKTVERLKFLEKTYSGPKLADYDLQLRGAGEIFGTRQHGHLCLKFADLTNLPLVKETKEAAQKLISSDPTLSQVPLLKNEIQKYKIEDIAPD